MLYELDGIAPQLLGDNFVAPNAALIGRVVLHPRASVWFGSVLRADNDLIEIGEGSNVQDLAVLHVDPGVPLRVGRDCTIGHQVMLHGCTIGDGTLIGIQSVILNRAVIGRNCVVAAGSLVTEGKQFPDRTMIMGSPAKVVRELTDGEVERFAKGGPGYAAKIPHYRDGLRAIDS